MVTRRRLVKLSRIVVLLVKNSSSPPSFGTLTTTLPMLKRLLNFLLRTLVWNILIYI
jgi:hypothetical protein